MDEQLRNDEMEKDTGLESSAKELMGHCEDGNGQLQCTVQSISKCKPDKRLLSNHFTVTVRAYLCTNYEYTHK